MFNDFYLKSSRIFSHFSSIRHCTDIICCILFVLAVLGYVILGILAWIYGDPRHVLYPRNSTGWFCGTGPNKDRPNLFYFDMIKCATAFNPLSNIANGFQCATTQVCVKECPATFWGVKPLDLVKNPSDVFNPELCVPSVDLQTTTLVRTCDLYLLSVLGRCLPDPNDLTNLPNWFSQIPGLPSINDTSALIKNGTGGLVNGFNAEDFAVKIFADFGASWPWILVGLVIAMVTSLLYLLLLRFIAPVMVWVLIIGVLCGGAYGIWHSYREYDNYNKQSASISDVGLSTNFSAYLQEIHFRQNIIWFRLVALLFNNKHICLHRAVSLMMSVLFYPLITFVMLLICVAYCGSTALYLATSGAPIYKVVALNSTNDACKKITSSCDPKVNLNCIFTKYSAEGLFQENASNLQIYNMVAFLWCVNFIIALGQCTLAGAFASYYWAFEKPADIPMFPVCDSFLRALRYHTGSLAFGALILTLVQIVRLILEYIDRKTKRSQNKCARYVLICLKCCFWCLEKCVKFLNRNAYIMIAIYGKNFCVSAKNAFMLLMRNIVRVVVLDKVTDMLLFFGKLMVVGGVGVLSFFFFTGRISLPGNTFSAGSLNYYWVPMVAVIIGSFLIASGFFSVYNMCVDTLFLCFLEDLERNDGSNEKPYYMSKKLMQILQKKNA
uniref:Choline transporter-like protein n=1 Tax=Neogobius melanostomus TaxID=47308 RepID=A0A8C6WKM9_9GOBI